MHRYILPPCTDRGESLAFTFNPSSSELCLLGARSATAGKVKKYLNTELKCRDRNLEAMKEGLCCAHEHFPSFVLEPNIAQSGRGVREYTLLPNSQKKVCILFNGTVLKAELKPKRIEGSWEFSKGVDLFTTVKA